VPNQRSSPLMRTAPNDGRIHRSVDARAPWNLPGSILLYAAFAAIVFLVQGREPLLGPDHLTYFQLADSIIALCSKGDYWREANSVRSFGVLLAYLQPMTGSHVLSMKIVLAAITVPYLLSAELLFGLFTQVRWQAVLFAILSGFAVSFGIASWGVTDSTALLPRTLVAPVILLTVWIWLRFRGSPARYLVFPLLVLGSLLHLSTFYLAAVFALLEVWDYVVARKLRIDWHVPAFLLGLVLAGVLLLGLEIAGLSSKMIGIQIPYTLRSLGIDVKNLETGKVTGCVPDATAADAANAGVERGPVRGPVPLTAAGASSAPGRTTGEAGATALGAHVKKEPAPLTAREAWEIELNLRPWRNMPLPAATVANTLSSSMLILMLAFAGMVIARKTGPNRMDRFMFAMFCVVPIVALLPQTILWGLRSFTSVFPATIEEVRAISLIMIPALYYVLRLFRHVVDAGGRRSRLQAAAIVVGVVSLPLLMKALPGSVRQGILSAMTAIGVVDERSPASVANARSALGISAKAPFYYATRGVSAWIKANTPSNARILTDRDDLVLLSDKIIIGSRQVGVTTFYASQEHADAFFWAADAFNSRDTAKVERVARALDADYFVVPWPVDRPAYADEHFSVVAVR